MTLDGIDVSYAQTHTPALALGADHVPLAAGAGKRAAHLPRASEKLYAADDAHARNGVCLAPPSDLDRVASSAMPMSVAVSPSVCPIERMAVDTMGLGALGPAEDVRSLNNRLQMPGIDASPDATEMVEHETGRERPNGHAIGHSVSQKGLARYPELPIAGRGLGSSPEPACLGLVNLGPEALGVNHLSIVHAWQYQR